jgi:hypothetical protein
VNADAAGVLAALEEEEVKGRDQWDKVTIPKLEAYSGYDQPRPLWLLIKVCHSSTALCHSFVRQSILLCCHHAWIGWRDFIRVKECQSSQDV